MTINDKAKQIIPDAFDEDEIIPARVGFMVKQQRIAFCEGADWMLKKAMALIEDSVVFDKFGRPVKSETFRKALEE